MRSLTRFRAVVVTLIFLGVSEVPLVLGDERRWGTHLIFCVVYNAAIVGVVLWLMRPRARRHHLD